MDNENKMDWYQTQKAVKSKHYRAIVRELQKGPMIFFELWKFGKETGTIRSQTGLSRMLDELEAQGIINQKTPKKDSRGIKRMAYALTDVGVKIAQILPTEFSVYEQYELKTTSDELLKVQTFMKDIITDNDIFSDPRLPLTIQSNRLWNFGYLVRYSLLLDNRVFDGKLARYLKRFADDRKKFIRIFGKIDFTVMQQLIDTIKVGDDPLDNETMAQKLVLKGKGTNVDMLVFTYINAAKIFMFNEKNTYQKLSKYEQEKWREFYDEDSKFRRLITKTRGAIE